MQHKTKRGLGSLPKKLIVQLLRTLKQGCCRRRTCRLWHDSRFASVHPTMMYKAENSGSMI